MSMNLRVPTQAELSLIHTRTTEHLMARSQAKDIEEPFIWVFSATCARIGYAALSLAAWKKILLPIGFTYNQAGFQFVSRKQIVSLHGFELHSTKPSNPLKFKNFFIEIQQIDGVVIDYAAEFKRLRRAYSITCSKVYSDLRANGTQRRYKAYCTYLKGAAGYLEGAKRSAHYARFVTALSQAVCAEVEFLVESHSYAFTVENIGAPK